MTWSQVVNIYKYPGFSEPPAIAIDSSGNLNVVCWNNTSGNDDIYFVRSTDDGTSWSEAVNISKNPGYSRRPAIAVDASGNINVVWRDDTSGNIDIYFSRSTNDGVSWSNAVNLSKNSGISDSPDIAVDSAGNINVVWDENTSGNIDVYFSRSTNDGVSWSQTVNISNSWRGSELARIAVDVAGNINVVWCEYTPQFGGSIEIYFSRSIDGGVSWSQVVKIPKLSGPYDTRNCIAVDHAGNISLLWCDFGTPGNTDIYFARSTR